MSCLDIPWFSRDIETALFFGRFFSRRQDCCIILLGNDISNFTENTRNDVFVSIEMCGTTLAKYGETQDTHINVTLDSLLSREFILITLQNSRAVSVRGAFVKECRPFKQITLIKPF